MGFWVNFGGRMFRGLGWFSTWDVWRLGLDGIVCLLLLLLSFHFFGWGEGGGYGGVNVFVLRPWVDSENFGWIHWVGVGNPGI